MSTAAILQTTEIFYLPVDIIAPNPYQPRKHFDRGQLVDLANSIKEYGVMQPISVRYIDGGYELVAGERRLRASKLAEMETIPAVVVNISDQDSAILALIENLQRQNLNYLEEAEGFQSLLSDYAFTQDELAKKIGKSQSTIANKLRILRLSKPVKKILLENDLSERHARALLKLEKDGMDSATVEELQLEILAKVVKDGLTVKKTEDLVELALSKLDEKDKPSKAKVKSYIKDIRLFTNSIKQAVDIMNSSGVATIYDVEENKDGCFISIMVAY